MKVVDQFILDQAVNFVLNGSKPLPFSTRFSTRSEDFGPVIPDTQVLILAGVQIKHDVLKRDVFMVLLLARLYDSETVESYQLTCSETEIHKLNGRRVLHVRYRTHEIRSMTLADHALIAAKASQQRI